MKADMRQVFVYYCDIVSQKSAAVLPTMSDLIAIWDAHRRANAAKIAIMNGEMDLVIGDIVVNSGNRSATLLLRLSDKTAADVVYSNIASNNFVTHNKATGWGGETGIHVCVSLDPEQGTQRRYTFVIEKAPVLDRVKVRRLLNTILSREYSTNQNSFEYDNPGGQRDRSGNIRKERALPRIELEGQPSPSLANDIQNGRLTALTLVETTPQRQVGGVQYLTQTERRIAVKIDHGSLPANLWSGLRQALRREAPTYPIAQIGIRLPNRDKIVSVKVDSATGAPLTDLYIKSFDINGINPLMSSSSQVVVPHFNVRIEHILNTERTI